MLKAPWVRYRLGTPSPLRLPRQRQRHARTLVADSQRAREIRGAACVRQSGPLRVPPASTLCASVLSATQSVDFALCVVGTPEPRIQLRAARRIRRNAFLWSRSRSLSPRRLVRLPVRPDRIGCRAQFGRCRRPLRARWHIHLLRRVAGWRPHGPNRGRSTSLLRVVGRPSDLYRRRRRLHGLHPFGRWRGRLRGTRRKGTKAQLTTALSPDGTFDLVST